jgi:ABC-type bacteriocin/lantibiotic exporter with double-glycine peptidase domain
MEEFSWRAPEFKYYYKDASWYWTSGIIAGTLILISLFQKNFLLVIFLILAELIIIMWAKQIPRTIDFKIDEDGIHCGKLKSYLYEELDGFCMEKDNEEAGELILKTQSTLNPFVKINIFTKDQENINNILKNFLDEVEYEESFSDKLSDFLKF